MALNYGNHFLYFTLGNVQHTKTRSIVFKTEDEIATFVGLYETIYLSTKRFFDVYKMLLNLYSFFWHFVSNALLHLLPQIWEKLQLSLVFLKKFIIKFFIICLSNDAETC